MTYTIDIQNEAQYPIDVPRLIEACTVVLKQHKIEPNTGVSVVFVDNATIQQLNQQHRQLDAPTDVLSFPADPLPEAIQDEPPYLGDLIIAYTYASDQATTHQHNLSDSLCLLVIHGTLHLLGYDHDTPDNRSDMWAAQATALHAMGINDDIVPTLEGD